MYKFSEYLEHRDPKLYESIDEGMGANLWQGAKQLWSGLKSGFTGAVDAVSGPKANYESALTALKTARKQIAASDVWKNSTTTGIPDKNVPAMNLVAWMDATIEELTSQIKQIGTKQVAGNTVTAAQPAPGADFDPAGRKGI